MKVVVTLLALRSVKYYLVGGNMSMPTSSYNVFIKEGLCSYRVLL